MGSVNEGLKRPQEERDMASSALHHEQRRRGSLQASLVRTR